MDNWKKELANNDESGEKGKKVTTMEGKFESNIKGWDVDIAVIQQTLIVQPDEL